jgi:hypothetical protein
MFAAVVRWGNSAPSCATYPMPRRCAGTDEPRVDRTRSPSRMLPASGSSNPAMRRSSVLLPLPDAPTMAVREPCGTSSEMSSSTGVEPNAFETPETVSFIGFDLPGSA